jgi:hypothetical protein
MTGGAFRVIACDHRVDGVLRMEAASQLPGLDRRAAAQAFHVMAYDHWVDPGLRSAAIEQLEKLEL